MGLTTIRDDEIPIDKRREMKIHVTIWRPWMDGV